MKGLFSDVLDIYNNEVELLDYFTQISEDKTEVLKKNHLEELDKIIRLEEALLMKFAVLEKRKQKVLEMIRIKYNISSAIGDDIIRENMTDSEYEMLESLQKRFSGVVGKQEKSLYLNRKIIKERNDSIKVLLDKIEEKHYSIVTQTTGLLDRRA